MSSSSHSNSSDATRTLQIGEGGGARQGSVDSFGRGTTVSRYVVLAEIAHGGMGRVLHAYDPRLQREVALKLVHAASLDERATARLVAEARAMAKLSHPHVVAIYDVEALAPGEVVLVMEYVPGKTLRDWLLERERGWPSIVAHFLEAGRGLAAAHDAGLLHRDFKPANVLVSQAGPVKVTDFGVAKLAGGASTGESSDPVTSDDSLTVAGSIVGTPRYMAPEQHRGVAVTAAADQYAFCVALWEAVCGEPPFSGKTMAENKAAGPPKWPRPATPRRLSDAVRRGLSPNPNDRWPSMRELLHTLARDNSRRRNRWLLAGGALSVLAAGVVSHQAWSLGRAQRCTGANDKLAGIWDNARREQVSSAFAAIGKSYAETAAVRTTQALDAYASEWAAMRTDACEATTVRGEQSAALMDLRMGCLARAAVDLQAVVEVLGDADADVVAKASTLINELRPLQRCVDTEALTAQVEPPNESEAEAVEAARTQLARARGLLKAGRYDAAQTAVASAADAVVDVEYGPVQAEIALAQGTTATRLAQFENSQVHLEKALRLGMSWRQRDVALEAVLAWMHLVGISQQRMEEALQLRPLVEGLSAGDPRAEAKLHYVVAGILRQQGKYREAETEERALLAQQEATLPPDDAILAQTHDLLGSTLFKQGKYSEAEAEFRTALSIASAQLGPEHPDTLETRGNLGAVLFRERRYAEAEAELRAALVASEAELGSAHPDVSALRSRIAGILHEQGRYAEAEVELRAALDAEELALGGGHPRVSGLRHNLALLFAAQSKYAEAEALFRQAISEQSAALGAGHPAVLSSRHSLAFVLRQQSRDAEAEREIRAILPGLESALGADHSELAIARRLLGTILVKDGRYGEAEAVIRAALDRIEVTLGGDHPDLATTRTALADVLRHANRLDEALALGELAWTRQQRDDIPVEDRAATAFLLARSLWEIEGSARDRARAHSLARQARAAFANAPVARPEPLGEVEHWLSRHHLP